MREEQFLMGCFLVFVFSLIILCLFVCLFVCFCLFLLCYVLPEG